jgi:DNA primase
LVVPVDSPEYKNAIYYLKKRGLTRDDIVRYNIGYCEKGEYDGHVIVPSYDADGKLNFFMGRRYYNVERVIPHKKPEVPMNLIGFECFVNYSEPLILVEAPLNAITIRKNAIPLFGKYPSKKLYEAIILNGVKVVYVCLDSDATQDALQICERLLRLNVTPYLVELQGGKDPNELGFEKTWSFIKTAKEVDFPRLMLMRLYRR